MPEFGILNYAFPTCCQPVRTSQRRPNFALRPTHAARAETDPVSSCFYAEIHTQPSRTLGARQSG